MHIADHSDSLDFFGKSIMNSIWIDMQVPILLLGLFSVQRFGPIPALPIERHNHPVPFAMCTLRAA